MGKYKSFILVLSGYAIGHGSLFLALSYLFFEGQIKLVSDVGIVFGLLTLIQWVSDGGGTFILSQLIEKKSLRKYFGSYVIVRFFFSILAVLFVHAILITFFFETNLHKVAWYFYIIPIIWSFNLTGLLDNIDRNKLAGPLSSLPVLFFTSSVLFSNFFNFELSVSVIFYCLGLLILVILQWFIFNSNVNYSLVFIVRYSRIKILSRRVISFTGGYLIAQGYGRIVPLIIEASFTSSVSGVYVYAKTIANISSQFVNYSRRSEFKELLASSSNNPLNFYSILKFQKLSILISLVFLFLFFLNYTTVYFFGFNEYLKLSNFLFIMSFLNVLWVFTSVYGPLSVSLSKEYMYFFVITSAAILNLINFYVLKKYFDVYSIFIAECFGFLFQFYLYQKLLQRKAIN